jgi:TolA-binding protein
MLKRRSRIVSFRLSDEEYNSLKSVSAMRGARSVSDFTRSVACNMNAGENGNENGNGIDKIEDELRTLNDKMEALDHSIQMLAEEIKEKDDTDSTDSPAKERLP